MPDTVGCKTRRRVRKVICALALLLTNAASAHDTWLNGDEVDPVTKGMCCGIDDTKVVDDLVRANANGSIWFIDLPGMLIPTRTYTALSRRTLVALNDLRRGLRHRPLCLRAIQ
jgi:hypothetical protein